MRKAVFFSLFVVVLSIFMISGAAAEQKAIFPFQGDVNISQGFGPGAAQISYDINAYEHISLCAVDYAGYITMYAPFDMKVVETGGTYVVFQSIGSVALANGSTSPVCLFCAHCDNPGEFGIYVGKEFSQGSACYRGGNNGISTGAHVHMEIGLGILGQTIFWSDHNGEHFGNQVGPDQVFFVDKSKTSSISDPGNNFSWVSLNQNRKTTDMSYATHAHILLGSNQNAALAVDPATGYVQVADVADTATQLWRFEKLSDGSYCIVSHYNGKVLDVVAGGYDDGTRVQVYEGSYQYNQKWIVYLENGHHVIVPQYTQAKCLDVDGGSSQAGTKVQIWTDNGTVAQQFYVFNRNTTPLPTSLSIGTGDIELKLGKTTQLTGNFSPADIIDSRKGITWTTSNSAVATVNSSGLVTGIGYGTATITAISVFNPMITASRIVKVDNAIDAPQITALTVSGKTVSLAWTESPLTNDTDVRTYEVYVCTKGNINPVWSDTNVTTTSCTITMSAHGEYTVFVRAVNKTEDVYSMYSSQDFTILDGDWMYTDILPDDLSSVEIQYLNHYDDREQAESPGEGWTRGASHTTYTNGNVIYSEELDPLQESDTLVYIGNFYYHYCDGNNEVEHFWTDRFCHRTVLDDNGQFDIVYEKADGSDARFTVYCLKWNSGEYSGSYATCPNGPYNESMALYYRGRRYQQRTANITYTWSRENSWNTEQDPNADSISYRIRTINYDNQLIIPMGVTRIEAEAFMGDTTIEEVFIPNGCEYIGSKAFAGCTGLRRVHIPSNTVVEADAFEACSQVTIVME